VVRYCSTSQASCCCHCGAQGLECRREGLSILAVGSVGYFQPIELENTQAHYRRTISCDAKHSYLCRLLRLFLVPALGSL
jgi:hypothetical protein